MTQLRNNKKTRWAMMLILAFIMFAVYVAMDNVFSIESTLTGPNYGITESEYSNLAGAYSIFNVYLLMLIFGGIILDKSGIRFTGFLSCLLMIAGTAVAMYSFIELRNQVASGETISTVNFLGDRLRLPVFWAVMGIGLFGVGAEIIGITVTKAIAKWFANCELALALGLQLAISRLGTGLAYGITPLIDKNTDGNVGLVILIGLLLLTVGAIAFVVYAIFDKKLDRQISASGITEGSVAQDEEFHLKDVGNVIKNPAFWLIALLCLLFYSAVNPFLKYSTGLMVTKFGLSAHLAGLLPMILPMGGILLTPLFGNIYDKKGRGADLMILGAILILGVHLTFAIPDLDQKGTAIILMALLGVGFSILPSAMWPSLAKIMPAKLLGTTIALTFFIQNIGYIFVPKVIGAIKSAPGCGYSQMSLFLAGLGALALILAIGVKLLDKRRHYGLQEPNIK